MTSDPKPRRTARLTVALALTAAMVCPSGSAAQVTTNITSSGLGTTITPAGPSYDITGGARRGSNLFHSFGNFSVGAGDAANFLNDTLTATSNIIGRVTGPNVSSIFGTIRTTDFGTANLFLINPAGWIFGATAALDVRGSFYASTADYVKLSDGAKFYADLGKDSGLTSAAPAAFGFLGPPDKLTPPAPISVEGAILQVDPGQTLSLIGGDDLQIKDGAALIAQGGVVQLGSVTSAGEAGLFAPDSSPDLDLGSFSSRGQITISNGAAVVAGSDGILPGGKVVIRSGQLIVDNAFITTDTVDLAGAPVGIDLGVTDSIAIQNGAVVQTASFGLGDASGISIATGNLAVTDLAHVESLAFSTGRTGAIDIQVGSADILNGGVIRTSSTASGAGDVTIGGASAGALTLSGLNSEISTETFANDPAVVAGNISITDFGNVILSDQATIRNGGLLGQGGNSLTVTAGNSLAISGLAGISSQSFSADVGVIDVAAPSVTLDSGFINTSTLGTGNAGRVLVTADMVSLTNGAQIASSSQIAATGSGGNVTINAPAGSVAIAGVGPANGVGDITFTGDPRSGLFSTAQGSGAAGTIVVNTPTLTISEGAAISVATSGAGNAGNVSLNVTNFNQTGGARVDSSTSNAGQGGDVSLAAANSATISGAGTGLFSTASGTGAGGDINVQAAQFQMLASATISANSTGTGNAGNVTISGGQLVSLQNSSITTGATIADGGIISITTTGSLVQLSNSQITTAVQSGVGGGGNIGINSELVTLNNSGVRADAFGGPGGNINIRADVFLSSNSIVSASSALSTPGVIDIQASFTDVSGDLAQLPETTLRATDLLRAACAARFAGGKASSLVLAGRDGMPLQPGGLLPSPLYLANKADVPSSAAGVDLQRFSLLGPTDRGLNQYSLLANARCSL